MMIATERLQEIVGKGNVSFEPAVLEQFSRDLSFVNTIRPEYVIKLRTTSEVERLVKLANETFTPLIPMSSGYPHFHGNTVPGIGGAIIVDLSDMKKIIRVDRINRSVMFEPGVTFGELIPAVAKEGLRLNMPLLPRKSKSVVASMLEREPVIMPQYHWDISDPLNCTEVIFGNGDTFRTGAAAGPGTLEEQWAAGGGQAEAAGPSSASWYRVIQGSQGTFGIVTWASARCEILPRLEKPFFAGSNEINRILELVHWLIRLRIVNECFILNKANLATMMFGDKTDCSDAKENLPQWILFFNIAGYDYLPEVRVKGQARDMLDVAQKAGLEPVESIGKISAFEFLDKIKTPSEEPFWKARPGNACQDIFFLTVYDKLPELMQTMVELARKVEYSIPKMGVYIQPIVQGTCCHCEFDLFYDPANLNEVGRVKKIIELAAPELMAKGAFFSRPYGENARKIINRDSETVNVLRKVKSILDPQNIMNPGKLCF
jgi:FAD/FMN-containing dehydrogenase